jgi:hypothetical protein
MMAKHGPTRQELHKQAKGIVLVYFNLKHEADAGQSVCDIARVQQCIAEIYGNTGVRIVE